MTRETYITKQDRYIWQRYRQEARDTVAQTSNRDAWPIEGAEAIAIAEYVDGRLNAREAESFEGRLLRDPDLLEATLAAQHALAVSYDAGDPEAPQPLVAYAANLVRPSTAPRSVRRQSSPLRRPFFMRPAIAALCAVAFVAIVAVSVVMVVSTDGTKTIATGPSDKKIDVIGEQLDNNGNTIFNDPNKTFYDGTDVE